VNKDYHKANSLLNWTSEHEAIRSYHDVICGGLCSLYSFKHM